MPRSHDIEKIIPALYRNNALNLIMFGYVQARSERSGVTVRDAIEEFMRDFELTHEDINTDSAAVLISRMRSQLINL